jgi:hypothetical protein
VTHVYLVVRNESYHYGTVEGVFGSNSDAEAWIDENETTTDQYRVERRDVE